ncbi:MBL fold metallo-hydrolase [Lachnospiraceae bacterium ZAX-1]
MQRIKNIFSLTIRFVLLLSIFAFSYFYLYREDVPLGTDEVPAQFFFIQTEGDADCILLKQGDFAVLVDTGEERDANSIIAFLKEQNISEISYLIFTHPDNDHIGGASHIITSFQVKNIIQPYYTKENTTLDELNQLIGQKRITLTYPTRPRSFTVGEIRFTVYPPLERNYKKINNYSLATLVSYGEINLLLAGDAEEKRLQELMMIHWPSIMLYKAPHHGRASSSSDEFIERITPAYTIVTSSDSDESIKAACAKIGSELIYTADAFVHFKSNGITLQRISE